MADSLVEKILEYHRLDSNGKTSTESVVRFLLVKYLSYKFIKFLIENKIFKLFIEECTIHIIRKCTYCGELYNVATQIDKICHASYVGEPIRQGIYWNGTFQGFEFWNDLNKKYIEKFKPRAGYIY